MNYIPILTFDGTFVFAVSEDSPSDALEKIATFDFPCRLFGDTFIFSAFL